MRKIILTGILIFTLVFSFICVKSGIGFPTKVYSSKELKAKRETVDMQLNNLTNLKSNAYANTQKTLKLSIQNFNSTKKMYEAAMESKTAVEKERAIAGVSYDLSYLWVKIGQYATKNNCDLTIEVFQNQETTTDENYVLCDFKFNFIASYADAIGFIEKISMDSELNFIPENLKMSTEYREVRTDEQYNGQPFEEEDVVEARALLLVTEFYKTNVPIAKSSLSKVENQLTIEAEAAAAEEAAKNGNTTANNTNNTANKANTTNSTNNTTNTTNTTK